MPEKVVIGDAGGGSGGTSGPPNTTTLSSAGRKDLPLPYRIIFKSAKTRVAVWPGDGPPVVTGGYGGWNPIARPQRTALTRWQGFDPIQIDIPIMIEGFHRGQSIEYDIAKLEQLAGRGPGVKGRPPKVRIIAPGNLVPHADDDLFVIQNIVVDPATVITGREGNRQRVFATVSVMQHVEADNETQRSAARRNEQDAALHHYQRSYVVKKGDTLPSISWKVYATPDFWTDIRSYNQIRDPRTVGVRTGTKPGDIGTSLKMPKE